MSFGSLSEALNQPKLLKASEMSYFTRILCFFSPSSGPVVYLRSSATYRSAWSGQKKLMLLDCFQLVTCAAQPLGCSVFLYKLFKEISMGVHKADKCLKFLFITGVLSEYFKSLSIDMVAFGFCLFLQKYRHLVMCYMLKFTTHSQTWQQHAGFFMVT